MADQFTPPPVSSWQGPAQAAGAFTPPPPSAWQGIANPDPNYKPPSPTLPPSTGDIIGQWLPYLGAAAGTAMTGGGALPAIGAAMLGGAAGSIPKQLMMEKPPQSVSEFTTGMGNDALEQGLNETGGRVVNKLVGSTIGKYFDPEHLYQSGLKPTGDFDRAKRVVATGLAEELPPSRFASDEARKRIDAISGDIKNLLTSNPVDIPPQQYVRNVQVKMQDLRNAWSKSPTNAAQNIGQIDDMERQFLLSHANPKPLTTTVMKPGTVLGPNGKPVMVPTQVTVKPEDMTLSELRQQAQPLPSLIAQDIKQAGYRDIRRSNEGAWEKGSNPAVSIDVEKGITNSLRKDLETVYPQLRTLNPRQGDLINLEDALKDYTKREMNKQSTPYFVFPIVGGMLGAAGGAAGGAATAGEGGVAGVLMGHFVRQALEDSSVKGALAVILNKAGKTTAGKIGAKVLPYVAPNTIRLGEGLLTNGMPEPPR